jgi:transposase
MEPYPKWVRDRIIELYEQGKGTKAIADLFGLCRSGVRRVRQMFRARGTTDPLPRNAGRGPGLDEADRERLRELVKATPDATLAELHESLGADVSVSTVDRWLTRLGLPLKKKSRRAGEQDRPDVKQEREAWPSKVAGVPAEDYVFLDEFGAKTNMSRTHGRCPAGERPGAAVPHGHWKVLTTIAALTARGIVAAVTVGAATDADLFRAFVADALVPTLRPGQVVVMDNLSSHKAAGVAALIEAAGCRVEYPEYLPPYSPDLNPVENAISKIKARLRKIAARTVEALGQAIQEAMALITPDDAKGSFRHCGYPAT